MQISEREHNLYLLEILQGNFKLFVERAEMFGGWKLLPVSLINGAVETRRAIQGLVKETGAEVVTDAGSEEYLSALERQTKEVVEGLAHGRQFEKGKILEIYCRNLTHLTNQQEEYQSRGEVPPLVVGKTIEEQRREIRKIVGNVQG